MTEREKDAPTQKRWGVGEKTTVDLREMPGMDHSGQEKGV